MSKLFLIFAVGFVANLTLQIQLPKLPNLKLSSPTSGYQTRPRHQAAYPFVRRQLRAQFPAEITRNILVLYLQVYRRKIHQHREPGCPNQCPRICGVEQRSWATRVSRNDEPACILIPKRQSIVADQSLEKIDSPASIRRERNLRVGNFLW